MNNLNITFGCQVLLSLNRERAEEVCHLKITTMHNCTGWVAEKHLPNLEVKTRLPLRQPKTVRNRSLTLLFPNPDFYALK